MDRQLTEFAARLLSHSKSVEGETGRFRRDLERELELLGSLEALARRSLASHFAPLQPNAPEAAGAAGIAATAGAVAGVPPAPQQAQPRTPPAAEPTYRVPSAAATSPRRPATSAPAPSPVNTRNDDYRPALGNPGVVNALLELQRRNPAALRRGGAHRKPEEGFAPAEVAQVEAQPKPNRFFRRAPGIYQPILRAPKPR